MLGTLIIVKLLFLLGTMLGGRKQQHRKRGGPIPRVAADVGL